MRRLALIVMVGVVVFTVYTVFAQEKEKTGEEMMPKPMMTQKGAMQMCPMGGGCPMGMMACMSMAGQSLAATEDGGVVLMAGCKLVKYDSALNKVKEVQIEMDVEAMQAKMQKMMKACGCPMCQQMMKMKMMGEEKKTE